MSNFHLSYAISRRTPPSSQVWRAIQTLQSEVNRRCSWTHERLSLVPERQTARVPFSLSLFPICPGRAGSPYLGEREADPMVSPRIPEAWALGSTRVRDSLWCAHLVVAFLRHVSAKFPELLFELRDDGGFVLAGAVVIRAGKVELARDWLNRARERALETSGDPHAAAPFIYAEHEGLEGRFFLDGVAFDVAEVPEVRELDPSWEQLQTMSIAELAAVVVDNVATAAVPARA